MEGVRERAAVAGQRDQLVDEEGRLAAARLRRVADRADDVAEVDLDVAGALDRAQELDPPAAIDEVEEDELPHVAPCHDSSGQTPGGVGVRAVLERLGLGANRRDLVAVRKALRQAHGAASLCARTEVRPPDLSGAAAS